jgi:Uma2 family endonuclease
MASKCAVSLRVAVSLDAVEALIPTFLNWEIMTLSKAKFESFDEYLTAELSDLPEGRYEYWNGELVRVMAEYLSNSVIANYLYFLLMQAGINHELIHPGKIEVVVPGRPMTRFPDLTVLDEIHSETLKMRSIILSEDPPPRLVVEVVSFGDIDSYNYKLDYQDKCHQYAHRGIPEYWLIDSDRAWVMVGTLVTGPLIVEHYKFKIFRDDDLIQSPSFPQLNLTAVQILQAGKAKI